jgi:hypothetical protein
MQPCEQEHEIKALVISSEENKNDTKALMKGQEALAVQHMVLVQKLDSFFDRLEAILLADMERRTQMDQALRDIDTLYVDSRAQHKELDSIKQRNATCDGAGVMDKNEEMWIWYQANITKSKQFTEVWNWFQQEKGWRRFVPTMLTVITGILAIYIGLVSIGAQYESEEHERSEYLYQEQILDEHHRAENARTYGIDPGPGQ